MKFDRKKCDMKYHFIDGEFSYTILVSGPKGTLYL